jgi:cellulose synthase/poly-beta-1,6-N-acetylglucosamine synthase-like glycosyltransferase
MVTVQLAVYNEMYVVERLLDAVARLDYPRERLEVQVLDDSTDSTTSIIANKIKDLKLFGLRIHHIRRPSREGYKAGALQYGFTRSQGELIAIFDADFLPEPDFLRKTIPFFDRRDIGMVQTRWEHINRKYSLLTEMQAFGLDAHFSIEQSGRNAGGHFINFNGTAGIWRKSCIEDAGGWQSDTLTEDLDLSYRAQLNGWKFKYIENVVCPSELPPVMSALKSQQYRWTKGAAETAKKHLWRVLSSRIPIGNKVHAVFHLLNSSVFIGVFLSAILSFPVLILKQSLPAYKEFFIYASTFLFSLVILIGFYWVSYRTQINHSVLRFVAYFPIFLSLSMGLSLHNAVAVIEGYLGRKTPFVRTPKFNLTGGENSWRLNSYLSGSISAMTLIEGILFVYFVTAFIFGFLVNDFGLMPFHFLLSLGFGLVVYYSVFHSIRSGKETVR